MRGGVRHRSGFRTAHPIEPAEEFRYCSATLPPAWVRGDFRDRTLAPFFLSVVVPRYRPPLAVVWHGESNLIIPPQPKSEVAYFPDFKRSPTLGPFWSAPLALRH